MGLIDTTTRLRTCVRTTRDVTKAPHSQTSQANSSASRFQPGYQPAPTPSASSSGSPERSGWPYALASARRWSLSWVPAARPPSRPHLVRQKRRARMMYLALLAHGAKANNLLWIRHMAPTPGPMYTVREALLVVRNIGFCLAIVTGTRPSACRRRMMKSLGKYGVDIDSREGTNLPDHTPGQRAMDTRERDARAKWEEIRSRLPEHRQRRFNRQAVATLGWCAARWNA